jgi:hypothetical protein
VAIQDVSAFMQLHGTPFSASQPFFPATTTLEALAQPRVVGVDAQVNFNHEANIGSNPIPDVRWKCSRTVTVLQRLAPLAQTRSSGHRTTTTFWLIMGAKVTYLRIR